MRYPGHPEPALKEAIGDAWCPQTFLSPDSPQREQRQLVSGREWDQRWVRGRCTGIAKDPTVRVGFSESVGTKVREASGDSSRQVKESNPVLQIKCLPRTECLLRRLPWVGVGIPLQN